MDMITFISGYVWIRRLTIVALLLVIWQFVVSKLLDYSPSSSTMILGITACATYLGVSAYVFRD